jgi:hypothetical protein
LTGSHRAHAAGASMPNSATQIAAGRTSQMNPQPRMRGKVLDRTCCSTCVSEDLR